MSDETLGYPGAKAQIDTFESFTSDSAGVKEAGQDWSWGYELEAKVSANAHRRVTVSWVGDAVMTVGEAMNIYPYPPDLTAADEPFLISVVEELLANEVDDTEKPEKENEDEPEELVEPDVHEEPRAKEDKQLATNAKTDTKPKIKLAPKSSTIAEPKPEQETHQVSEALEQPTVRAARPAEPEARNISAAQAEAEFKATAELDKPATADVRGDDKSGSPEDSVAELAAKDSAPELASATANVIYLDKPKTVTEQQVVAVEQTLTSQAEIPAVEAEPEFDNQQSTTSREFGTPSSFKPTEAVAGAWPEEALLVLEAPTISNSAGPSPEESELDEVWPIPPTPGKFDYQAPAINLADFVEEGLANLNDEAPLAADMQPTNFALYDEPVLSDEIEFTEPEQPIPADLLVVEEAESSPVQLNEYAQTAELKTVEPAYEAINKIIELPLKIVPQVSENTPAEIDTETREHLEELLSELLDMAGFEHTPELIESLTQLTIERYLVGENESLKTQPESDLPAHSATHEFIKNLLASSGSSKNPMAHASSLGKSALDLYSALAA